MHAACEIKNRNISFHNEKMKVFLAAETLRASAAAALRLLEADPKNTEFKNAEGTAQFSQNINDIFDILNTKNKWCKTPGRRGIDINNLDNLREKLDKFVNYIKKLRI